MAGMWVQRWHFVKPTKRVLRRCERSFRRLEGKAERKAAWAERCAQAGQVDLPPRSVGVQTDDAEPPPRGPEARPMDQPGPSEPRTRRACSDGTSTRAGEPARPPADSWMQQSKSLKNAARVSSCSIPFSAFSAAYLASSSPTKRIWRKSEYQNVLLVCKTIRNCEEI